MILRRSWMVGACGEIARNIPLNTPLIPTLTGMSSTYGTVVGDSVTDSANHVVAYKTSDIQNNAYRMFDSTNSGIVYSQDTKYARDISFTFSNNFYKGELPAGKYTFTSSFNDQRGSTIMSCGILYLLNMNNEWVQVAELPFQYAQGPYSRTLDFTVRFNFKGIKTKHTNPNDYSHTRYYQVWGYNIIKLS